MSARRLHHLPAVLWTTMFAILVVTVAMPVFAGKGLDEIYADPVVVVFFIFVLTFVTVGALVASKRPANAIGWIMIAAGIAYSTGGLAISVIEDVVSRPLGASLAGRYLVWLTSWVFPIGPLLSGTFLLLLFPTCNGFVQVFSTCCRDSLTKGSPPMSVAAVPTFGGSSGADRASSYTGAEPNSSSDEALNPLASWTTTRVQISPPRPFTSTDVTARRATSRARGGVVAENPVTSD